MIAAGYSMGADAVDKARAYDGKKHFRMALQPVVA
jgi:hypothetical protein